MKHLRILLIAFAAMLSVGVVSCDKDSSGSGNGGNNGGNIPGGGGNTTVEWVDLGLPSGLLWNSCNLGATTPEEYGNYYAWGETATKEVYKWDTYVYGNAHNELTKYCDYSGYGLNGFTDNLTTLEAMDDAATAALGNGVRMPSKEEWEELLNNTTVVRATLNGVKGRKFTASNGNTIFLPANGYHYDSGHTYAGNEGYYWSSSLGEDYPDVAIGFYFFEEEPSMCAYGWPRYYGFAVRAVRHN